MDFHQLVKHSIANIQDELTRIQTLTSLFQYKPSEAEATFQKKVLQEYNSKLHKMRSENARLHEKIKALTERVKFLEGKSRHLLDTDFEPLKARPFKSESSLKPGPEKDFFGPPTKKRTLNPPRANLEILSSPIKQKESEIVKKSPTKRIFSQGLNDANPDITSSQFNRLATQYSDTSSQIVANLDQKASMEPRNDVQISTKGGSLENLRFSSPIKNFPKKSSVDSATFMRGTFASDDESDENNPSPVVADSQDEFEPLGNPPWHGSNAPKVISRQSSTITKPKYPAHYTALQRVEFLRHYFRQKIADKHFKVDFSKNPITEKKWTLEDFILNDQWKPPKKINSNLGVMTKAQEKTYSDFFDKAGLGRKSIGPTWDSDEDTDQGIDGPDWIRSQVMDKYLSPPGYMVGDFVSTQEEEGRKRMIDEKEQQRIRRRFESAISEGEFLFYEKVFNDFVKTGRYVNGP